MINPLETFLRAAGGASSVGIQAVLSEATTTINWNFVFNLVMAVGTIGMFIVALRKKEHVSVHPQPLEIRMTEELNKQFAGKKEFDAHVRNNTERHGQLFNKIDAAERHSRAEMDRRFEELQLERVRNIREINEKFTAIQVDMGCIKTELKIRNEE